MDFDFKRMLTAVLLCMLIMYGWMFLTGKFKPQQPPEQTTPSATPQATAPAPQEADDQGTLTMPGTQEWRLQQEPLEQQEVVIGELINKKEGFKAQIAIDPGSASIIQVVLNEHKLQVTDKETGYPLLMPTYNSQGKRFLSFMLGELKLVNRPETFDLARNCWKLDRTVTDPSTGITSVSYTATIVDEQKKPILNISKSFAYGPDNYALDFSISLKNKSINPIQVESLEFFGPGGLLREEPRSDMRGIISAYMDREGKFIYGRGQRKTITQIKEEEDFLEKPKGSSLLWFGVSNKFFASIIHPISTNKSADLLRLSTNMIKAKVMYPDPADVESNLYTKTIGSAATLAMSKPLESQSEATTDFQVYLGPIDRDIFIDNPLYTGLNYEKLVSTQSCCTFCVFDWLIALLFKLIKVLYFGVGNYGIAIIIMVLMIRFMMHPITKKSQLSMMGMGKMAPKVEEIKKKYAGNKEEIQKRTMALYKEQGFTPIMGCLPMLLQMPIWIAMYMAVNSNVALRHQGLLPAAWHWLNDLAAPDRLIPFSWLGIEPVTIPLLGNMIGEIDAFNLLPLLLCVAFYLQTKYSPQSKMSASNPQMAQQQKMMMYMMPAMMLLFLYNGSSGFNLYFMASTFAGLIEQHFIRKHMKKEEETAQKGTADATTKISSRIGPKKKKPKPPIRFN